MTSTVHLCAFSTIIGCGSVFTSDLKYN